MPTAAEIRAKYPSLAGLDDEQVVDVLHSTQYPHAPREWVADKLGVKPAPAPPPVEEPSSALRRYVADPAISLLKGAIDVPEMAVGIADIPTGGHVGKGLEDIGFRPAEAKAYLDQFYSPEQKKAFEAVNSAQGLGDTVAAVYHNPSAAVHSAIESVPGMLAGGVVGRGARALTAGRIGAETAGAIGEGVTAGGQQVEQTREETPDGLLTPGQVALTAGSGVADALISKLGGHVAHKLGIHDIQTVLAGGDEKVTKGFTRSLLQGAAQEGLLEELPQSIQEQVAQNMALGKPLDEGVSQAAVLGAVTGGFMGAGGQALGRARAAQPAPEVEKPAAPLLLGHETGGAPIYSFPDGSMAVGDEARAAREKELFDAKYAPQPAETDTPLALGYQSGPTMFAFPDGSVVTGDAARRAHADEVDRLSFQNQYAPQPGDPVTAGSEPRAYGSHGTTQAVIDAAGLSDDHVPARNADGTWGIEPTGAPGARMIVPGVYDTPPAPETPGDLLRASAPPVVGPTSRAAALSVEAGAQELDANPVAHDAPAPVVPQPAHPLTDEHKQALLDHANARTAQLKEAEAGVPEHEIPAKTEDGEPTIVPAVEPRHLTPQEKAEKAFLEANGGDVVPLSHAYPADALVKQRAAARAATTAATPEQLASVDPTQIQPGDVLHTAGQPFKSRQAANVALGRHPDRTTMQVTPVTGGFALRPAQASLVQAPPTVRAPDGSQRAVFDTKDAADAYLKTARKARANATTMSIEPMRIADGRWMLATPAERAASGVTPAPAPAAPKTAPTPVKETRNEELPKPPAAPAQSDATTLPAELSGAKPRYAFGSKQFTLKFASDVDRAAYIAAQAKPSKQDAAFVQWARGATGMSEAEVRQHGAQVRAVIKEQARAAQTGGSTLEVADQRAEPSKTRQRISTATGSMNRDEAQRVVDRVTKGWKGAPMIHVVADASEIPGGEASDKTQGLINLHTGETYVVASQAKNPEELAKTVIHEVMGHLGLRAAFGGKLVPILDQLAVARPDLMKAKAEQYGYDLSKLEDRRATADEVLAELAETQPKQGFVQRAIAAVRQWLRSAGLKLQLTDNDIAGWLGAARRAIENGRPDRALQRLDQAMSAERLTPDTMLRQRLEAAMPALEKARDIAVPITRHVGNFMGTGPGAVGVWNKTVGTMFNLSKTHPAFAPVFDSIQTFLNDVSFYANRAADFAPNILPKLESWRDILKKPIAAADSKAIAAPIFDGTLRWTRDESGKPVLMSEAQAAAQAKFEADSQRAAQDAARKTRQYAGWSVDQKREHLLQRRLVSPEMVHAWNGMQRDAHERIVTQTFAKRVINSAQVEQPSLKAGIVFTDDELRSLFKLTPKQIELYHEFRNTVDHSLDSTGAGLLVRYGGALVTPEVRAEMLRAPTASAAADVLSKHLESIGKQDKVPGAREIADKIDELKAHGYAPLSRFGTFTLDVTDAAGERKHFDLFESDEDRQKALRAMQRDPAFAGMQFRQGTLSTQQHKLLAGISPDTAELFGKMLGLRAEEGAESDAADKAFQEYLKLTKGATSALKHLIHRKGVEGYSEDAARVLATHVYSNARLTATSLHGGEIDRAVVAIPQDQGQLKDIAVELKQYVQEPSEEAAALRGLLFAQYLGGSVASALVNATQPFVTTLPYLSQFGGLAAAGKHMKQAAALMTKMARNGGKTGDAQLDAALGVAADKGITAPQEVHQLMAQARGRQVLSSGDGTKRGDAAAAAKNTFTRVSLAWGKVFGVAEQFNRRLTYIAAYNLAREQGIAAPAKFAEDAVASTQFLANKGNKPKWARGAIGATLFTFKQYSVSYLEMVHRMATAGEPGSPERAAGRRAALYAIGALLIMAGADGLPFIEDIDDLIDGAMQRLGYNFSTKRARDGFFRDTFGKDLGDFITNGVSGLPGAPIDVSGRLGMANLIPGTGFAVDKADHTRDLAELFGPAGDLVQRGFQAAGQAGRGDLSGAATTIAPKAAQNILKAIDMGRSGIYRQDSDGKKVIDTDLIDAAMKAVGFQPRDVKEAQDAAFAVQKMVAENQLKQTQVTHAAAVALANGDAEGVQAAKDDVADWNRKNPDLPIKYSASAVRRQALEMKRSKDERLEKGAPKQIRETVRRQLAAEESQ